MPTVQAVAVEQRLPSVFGEIGSVAMVLSVIAFVLREEEPAQSQTKQESGDHEMTAYQNREVVRSARGGAGGGVSGAIWQGTAIFCPAQSTGRWTKATCGEQLRGPRARGSMRSRLGVSRVVQCGGMLLGYTVKRSTGSRTLQVLPVLLLLMFSSCSDGRPSVREATERFHKLYPEAEVTGARESEDEAVARSFVFKYRRQGSALEKEIEIQFMRDDNTGRWKPQPAPPPELP